MSLQQRTWLSLAAAAFGAALSSTALGQSTPAAAAPQGALVEWPVYGGSLSSQFYSPLDQIDTRNVKDLKVAWTWYAGNFGPNPEMKSETTPLMIDGVLYATAGATRNVAAIDAASGETLWVWRPNEPDRFKQAPRKMAGRGVSYWSDGSDDKRIFVVTPGFFLWSLDASTGLPKREFGEAGFVDLRRGLARADGQRRGGFFVAVARRRRRRDRRSRGRHRRAAELEDAGEARRARLRRAHGRAAVDVPHDPREGRVRLRHVAHAGLGGVHGQRGGLGADGRGSGARHRVSAGRGSDERSLRRRAARQQPVRQHARRARREDGPARLASPADSSRHLGLRQPDVADPARRDGRREAREGRRAAHEAGVRVRVQPRDRRAALADRGEIGADVRRAGRVDRGDAAVPDQAEGLRPPGRDRGRPRRLHSGDQGRGARGREGPAEWGRCSRRRR